MYRYTITWRRMKQTCDFKRAEREEWHRWIHTAGESCVSIDARNRDEAIDKSWISLLEYLKANVNQPDLKSMIGYGRSHWMCDPPECIGESNS